MLLTAAESAAKLGIRESQFRRAVRRGELPKPFLTCRPHRWAESQLEKVSEGSTVPSDALMERIHEYRDEDGRL
jgi:predicted DNA-binding transcriptional regulator AlpA